MFTINLYVWAVFQCPPWASYQIAGKIAGCACVGNAGNVFPAIDFKENRYLAIPEYITVRAWCMSGSLARGDGENILGISGACATRKFIYLVRGPLEW